MNIRERLKIHGAVEYIKQDTEFPFDTHDDPEDILDHYGIELELNENERQVLLTDLAELTEQAQTNEIVRQLSHGFGEQ